MKKSQCFPRVLFFKPNHLIPVLLLMGGFLSTLPAATLQWDPTGSTTPGASQDGNGTWSTSNNIWYNGSTAGNAWSNGTGDTAIFGSPGTTSNFTVTISGTVNAGAISLDNGTGNGAGQITLTGGTINGPSGGTMTLTDSNSVWVFHQDAINSVNFTGASTYQFLGSTVSTREGFGMSGDTFSGNLILGTGTDQGTLTLTNNITLLNGGSITVNSGTGGGWQLQLSGNNNINYNEPVTLNGLGNQAQGTLEFLNNTGLSYSGPITLGTDARS